MATSLLSGHGVMLKEARTLGLNGLPQVNLLNSKVDVSHPRTVSQCFSESESLNKMSLVYFHSRSVHFLTEILIFGENIIYLSIYLSIYLFCMCVRAHARVLHKRRCWQRPERASDRLQPQL